MSNKIKTFKKIRIHREGTQTLVLSFVAITLIAFILYFSFIMPTIKFHNGKKYK